ncbi:MAG: hypothetical protein R3C59_18995 [Planctomycetaceae bacterium]
MAVQIPAVFLGALLACSFHRSHARGDIIIEIPDITVSAGVPAHLDVLISSNADPLTPDVFQKYFLDFVVNTPGFFLPSVNPAPQLSATSPDYIFLGDSLETVIGLGIDFVNPSSDLLTVNDETFSTFDREISSADGSFLLARLNFNPPTAGTFEIELDQLTSGFFDIDDALAAEIDVTASKLSATVTVTAAVPEPGVLLFLTSASVIGILRRLRPRDRSTKRDSGLHRSS